MLSRAVGPAIDRRGPPVRGGHPDTAVEGDPAHEPAVGEVLAPSAGLPDALLRLVPVLGQPVQQLADRRPAAVPDRQPALVGEEDAVQRLAVDVELELVGGAVADADRARAAVTGPVLQRLLLEVRGAVDPVHDVQRATLAADLLGHPVPQPAAELRRFLGEPQPQQRVDGERGIAHPGEAVVPVALPADLLGQTGGRRGHQPTGRGVGHQLQRDGRALQHLPPAPGIGASGRARSARTRRCRRTSAGTRPPGSPAAAPRRPTPARGHERPRRSGRSTAAGHPRRPGRGPAARRRAPAPRAGSRSAPWW